MDDSPDFAGWKRIQQNTFTRWVNEHLRKVHLVVDDLQTDLTDGLLLIKLIEVLSQRKLPKHNLRPTFRSQKLENVSVALKFLENEESIKLVNIDSSDIVDQRLKLIMGLIWTLILHYSISAPIWDSDRELTDSAKKRQRDEQPKQRLLNWLNAKMPDMKVTNFTSQWNDGRRLGALVDSIAPGLCPEWDSWQPNYALKNTTLAMDLAEQWLTVPKLIEPEEFISPDVDELSMMTYLSQYPNAKLRPGAPLKPKRRPLPPSQVFVYGLNEETELTEELRFNVDTKGDTGLVEVFITDPTGRRDTAICVLDKRTNVHNVQWTPRICGAHKVSVKYDGLEAARSPYSVNVIRPKVDLNQVSIFGPGLRNGNVVNKSTYFDIITAGADQSKFHVTIFDPNSRSDTVKPSLRVTDSGALRCVYTPLLAGLHNVNIFYDHDLISKDCPLEVWVNSAVDMSRIRVLGRGIQATGVRLGDGQVSFRVISDAGDLDPDLLVAKMQHSNGSPLSLKRSVNTGSDLDVEFRYEPLIVGPQQIQIYYNGQQLLQSPFDINIGPMKTSRIKAFGHGLIRGVVDKPCMFTVETNGEVCSLGFSVEGPDKAEISCQDNNDGSVDVVYVPKAIGEYAVHILTNDEDIPNSPFMVDVVRLHKSSVPSLVQCRGSGLARTGNTVGKRCTFEVDACRAGKGTLTINGFDNNGNEITITQNTNAPGMYECRYVPKVAQAHCFFVSMDDQPVPGCPFRVYVQESAKSYKVRVMGPGLEKGVKSKQKNHFFIDCKDAGPGDLEVIMRNSRGTRMEDVSVADLRDGSYTVNYMVDVADKYHFYVRYAGLDVPGSPFEVDILPHLDLSTVEVVDLPEKVYVDAVNEFSINARKLRNRSISGEIECILTSPDKRMTKCMVTDQQDGTYRVAFSPSVKGVHQLDLTYDGIPITENPLLVNASEGFDSTLCKVNGMGLTEGTVGVPCRFTVDTRGAGKGNLAISIEGPSKAVISCADNNDGTCTAEYVVTKPGDYKIFVLFADEHLSGSPFTAHIVPPVDASLVNANGHGLEQEYCRYGVPLRFLVDTSSSGPALLNVLVNTNGGAASKQPEITDRGRGLYEVVYEAPPVGSNCSVHILYGGKEIPNSPYRMNVLPKFEPSKVIVSSPSDPYTRVGEEVTMAIDTSKAGYAPLQVLIKDPDGLSILAKHTEKNHCLDELSFVPELAGTYEALVKFGEQLISDKPFCWEILPCGDASKCSISEGRFDTATVDEEQCIRVLTDPYGTAKVSCQVLPASAPSKSIPTTIERQGDICLIFYTLPAPGFYRISVRYGGELLEKGQWMMKGEIRGKRFPLTPLSQENEDALLQRAAPLVLDNDFGKPLVEYFGEKSWTVTSPGSGTIYARVIMPSNKVDVPLIKDNHDGSITVKYQPSEPGPHELQIKYKNLHIPGSPFNFYVGKLKDGCVTAYGSGLSYGIAGDPAAFTVCAKQPQSGGLSVKVEGPAKAEVKCHDNKDGTCTITWIPPTPGEYLIYIQYAGNAIEGSPFKANVSGEGRKRAQISIGSTSEASIKLAETDLSVLSASIKSPSGIEEPCSIRKLESGNLGVSFTPREDGEHLITVKKKGVVIRGSPFPITVNKADVGNASKVVVTGSGIMQAITQEFNSFLVDTKNAGYGGLSVSLEGPSRCEIKCEDNHNKTSTVSYKPYEPGVYLLSVKFADLHVPGSPFTVHCGGRGVGTITETIEAVLNQAGISQPGEECQLSLKIPGASAIDLSARVMNPDGQIEDIDLYEDNNEMYRLRFVPTMEGVHTLSVQMRGMHVAGSPFQYTVGPFSESGSHKVHAGGAGLVSGEVNAPQFFNLYSREAGAGLLQAYMEGPSKAHLEYRETRPGQGHIMYRVSKPGDYNMAIKFDDKHIPDSPFKIYISSPSGEARKLEVCSFPDSYGLPVNKPVSFTVLTHNADGHLDAKVISPSGATDDCFITPIEERESYAIRFIPKEIGNHYVHITLDGMHMKDSPFRFRAGPKGEVDPIGITVHGSGLKGGETGQKCEFIINTCHVGPGNLQIQLDGPSKATLNAYDVDEGYKVRYTPLAPGDYYTAIKYNGIHIPGSPFKIVVTGKHLGGSGIDECSRVNIDTVAKSALGASIHVPKYNGDASKVACQGGGLKKAFAGRHNTFNVDCGSAGLDVLSVSVMTQKGPGDEVSIKHNGRGNFAVSYMIKERTGVCIIHILYGNKHVPGSPFLIQI